MSEGKVPRGVTVGNVDIGGMNDEQAEQRLRNQLGDSVREPVQINAGNLSTRVEPIDAGLQVDWARTVHQAGQQPLNPITRIKSFFETREVGIVGDINNARLHEELGRVHGELERAPQDANVEITPEGKGHVTPDVEGQKVDVGMLQDKVASQWLNKDHTVTVQAEPAFANIRKDKADEMVKGFIEPATASPVVFHGRDHVDGILQPQDMASVMTFVPEGDHFRPEVKTDVATQILSNQLSGTERQYRDANFIMHGKDFEVTPSQDGVAIKWQETLGDLQAKLLDPKVREHEVLYEDQPAKYTTEQAKKANFNDELSTFTTEGFSGPSGENIRRVAQMVDGAILLPGETFSLNKYTGPRGAAQGFVESGIIIDGHAGEAVGGGISQFATTLYNASYFAGLDDVAHTPHSYYISRYPAGREATVYENAIDLQFKNPFDTPIKISASADDHSVTVKMFGVKKVNVESIPGGRSKPTQPKRIELSGDKCAPSGGAPGFTTSDTRVVRDLSGREISRDSSTTVYDPQPIVTCKKD